MRVFHMPLLHVIPLVVAVSLHGTAGAAPTPCAPVPAGLVAWWRLENNGADATGAYNGAVVGGGFNAAEVGNGFRPAGFGSLVSVPDSPALNPANFTIDFWVRIDSWTFNNEVCFWKGDQGGADATSSFGIGVYGTWDARLGTPFVTIGTGSLSQELDALTTISLGAFHHIAATADGTTLSIYIDGVLSKSAVQTLIPAPSSYPIQIGGITGAPVNELEGTIDEVELHSQATTPAQILAIYEAGPAGKCPLSVPVQSTTWGGVKAHYRDAER